MIAFYTAKGYCRERTHCNVFRAASYHQQMLWLQCSPMVDDHATNRERDLDCAGLPVTVEVGAHYLVFAAEDIPDGDTHYKCAPPLRERKILNRLWGGLQVKHSPRAVGRLSPSPPGFA